MRKFLSVFALIVFAAGLAFAHGDKKHVVGTLVKISADSVVVKTATGQSVEVKLLGSTIFVAKSGSEESSAKASDLAVGDRVVIHATPKGETLEANEVKFSKATSAAVKPKS